MFKKDAEFNLIVMLGPAIVGGMLALLVPFLKDLVMMDSHSRKVFGGLALCMLGWLLLLKAKWSQIKSKSFLKFGMKDLSLLNKIFYCLAYTLLVTGIITTLWNHMLIPVRQI